MSPAVMNFAFHRTAVVFILSTHVSWSISDMNVDFLIPLR